MKRFYLFVISAVIAVMASAQVTFTVDENLPKVKLDEHAWHDSKFVAKFWLNESGAENPATNIVACSFEGERLNPFRDALYSTIVRAYNEHRPLVLSPDVIWLNICQVFCHYVQENAEAMRPRLVSHEDKMELVVETNKDLLTEAANWDSIMTAFTAQIDQHSKDGIARTLEADFSTTTVTERIASDITLMAAMHPFFNYTIFRVACGIPSITLTGTADDWRKVLAKTEELERFDMEWFTNDLKPILRQFIAAAEGNADRKFWRDMVKKNRPKNLTGWGCSPDAPTVFDGWFTKFFPYQKDGKRATKHTNVSSMLSSMVMCDFRYVVVGDGPTQENKMELWAGIIGISEDPTTYAYTPRIGWFVRKAEGMKKSRYAL